MSRQAVDPRRLGKYGPSELLDAWAARARIRTCYSEHIRNALDRNREDRKKGSATRTPARNPLELMDAKLAKEDLLVFGKRNASFSAVHARKTRLSTFLFSLPVLCCLPKACLPDDSWGGLWLASELEVLSATSIG